MSASLRWAGQIHAKVVHGLVQALHAQPPVGVVREDRAQVRGDLLRAPPGLKLCLLWEYDLAQLHVAA